MGFNHPDHFLPSNGKVHAREIVAFDIEGDSGDRGFLQASVVSGDGRYIVDKPEDLAALWHSRSLRDCTWYAHNLGYDLGVILGVGGYPISVTLIAGNVFKGIYYRGKDHRVKFNDSANLMGFLSLNAVGKSVGMEKYPTPPDLLTEDDDIPEWVCPRHHRKWCVECYCLQDSEIVYKAVNLFQEFINSYGANLGNTLAATAMNLYRAAFMDREYLTPFPNRNDYARNAYYGGRVEPIAVGLWEDVNCYDVNSLYPYVMSVFPYPDPDTLVGPTHYTSLELINKYEGVSDVTVDVPYSDIPLLPYRYDGKLFFPYGRLRGHYTHIELRRAMSLGARIQIIHTTLYAKRTCAPFRSYVETLYKRRLEYKATGDPREFVVKRLLNSLYGKFGQHADGALVSLVPIEEYLTRKPVAGVENYTIGNRGYVRIPVAMYNIPSYLNTLWAAYVTAYARLTLFDYLCREDQQVVYCDTDSVFVLGNLPTGKELGQLKLEVEHATYIGYAPKLYRLIKPDGESVFKGKGIPPRYQAQFLKDGYVVFNRPTRWLESLKAGYAPSVWIEWAKKQQYTTPKRCYIPSEASPEFPRLSQPWEVSELDLWCAQ